MLPQPSWSIAQPTAQRVRSACAQGPRGGRKLFAPVKGHVGVTPNECAYAAPRQRAAHLDVSVTPQRASWILWGESSERWRSVAWLAAERTLVAFRA